MNNRSIYDKMTCPEKEVAELLKDLGIKWSYEKPVFIWDEQQRPRVWTPDFYLSAFGIYIEVCGTNKFEYNYRRKIFNNNGYRVIFLHLYKEKYLWKNHLIKFLRLFTHYRYSKLIELLRY